MSTRAPANLGFVSTYAHSHPIASSCGPWCSSALGPRLGRCPIDLAPTGVNDTIHGSTTERRSNRTNPPASNRLSRTLTFCAATPSRIANSSTLVYRNRSIHTKNARSRTASRDPCRALHTNSPGSMTTKAQPEPPSGT